MKQVHEAVTNAVAAAGLTLPFWTVAEWLQIWSLIVAVLSALWLGRQIWLSFKKPK